MKKSSLIATIFTLAVRGASTNEETYEEEHQVLWGAPIPVYDEDTYDPSAIKISQESLFSLSTRTM